MRSMPWVESLALSSSRDRELLWVVLCPIIFNLYFCLETMNYIGDTIALLIKRYHVSLIFTNVPFFVCC